MPHYKAGSGGFSKILYPIQGNPEYPILEASIAQLEQCLSLFICLISELHLYYIMRKTGQNNSYRSRILIKISTNWHTVVISIRANSLSEVSKDNASLR